MSLAATVFSHEKYSRNVSISDQFFQDLNFKTKTKTLKFFQDQDQDQDQA